MSYGGGGDKAVRVGGQSWLEWPSANCNEYGWVAFGGAVASLLNAACQIAVIHGALGAAGHTKAWVAGPLIVGFCVESRLF